MADAVSALTWYGHATFSADFGGAKILFLDPYNFRGAPSQKADIVFITHAHYDHCSPADLRKVLKPETIVVAIPGCAEKVVPADRLVLASPAKSFEVAGLKVKTIPAYNIKPDRLRYHPRANNWVGYIIYTPAGKIYHAGDTDFVPEMKALAAEKLDVAMLPIGGTFTMTVDEAIEAANIIGAKTTVPMHYKAILKENAPEAEERFKAGVKGKVKVFKEVA